MINIMWKFQHVHCSETETETETETESQRVTWTEFAILAMFKLEIAVISCGHLRKCALEGIEISTHISAQTGQNTLGEL